MSSRVTSVESFILRIDGQGELLPDEPEYNVAKNRGTLYSPAAETVFVRIEADDGTVGWGECLAPVGPRVVAAIIEDIITPALLGADPREVRPLRQRLGELMRERGHLFGHQADALAGVDIALWDLAGKLHGVSVATLLGGAYRTVIPTYVSSIAGSTDEARAETIARLHRDGAQRFKLHLGAGVEADLRSIDVARAVAPDARFAVDVHCVYSVAEAIRLGRGLDERGIWFFESALPAENARGSAELARAIDTPVAAGEAMRNRYEVADWIAQGALDLYQPDIGRTGITEGSVIATLANAAYLPVSPHHSVATGPALAAGLHVAATTEIMPAFEYQFAAVTRANALLERPLDVFADHMLLPEGPGLGVLVREEKVRAGAVAR